MSAAIYLNTGHGIQMDGDEKRAEVFSFSFETEDLAGDPTFGDVETDEKQWLANFTATQDTTTDSVWDWCWSHPGEEVDLSYAPYGNDVASASQPHFTATAKISVPDGAVLGGEATKDRERAKIECSWKLNAKPVKTVS